MTMKLRYDESEVTYIAGHSRYFVFPSKPDTNRSLLQASHGKDFLGCATRGTAILRREKFKHRLMCSVGLIGGINMARMRDHNEF